MSAEHPSKAEWADYEDDGDCVPENARFPGFLEDSEIWWFSSEHPDDGCPDCAIGDCVQFVRVVEKDDGNLGLEVYHGQQGRLS